MAKRKPKQNERSRPNHTESRSGAKGVRKTSPEGHGYVEYDLGRRHRALVFDKIEMQILDPPEPVKRKKKRR